MDTYPLSQEQTVPHTSKGLPTLKTAHLMLDTETGGIPVTQAMLTEGTMAPPVILSLGAVVFDPYAQMQGYGDLHKYGFYRNICPRSCRELGAKFDPATVEWWKQQSDDARAALKVNQVPVQQAIKEFACWLSNHNNIICGYWANSPTFDVVLVKHYFETTKTYWPFKHFEEHDMRTLRRFMWPDGNYPNFVEGTAHNALDDAIGQARCVQFSHNFRDFLFQAARNK